MESNRSWSIDDYRNKFQFGCEYGKLIENGKMTATVKNPNYRGISNPFWNSLKALGEYRIPLAFLVRRTAARANPTRSSGWVTPRRPAFLKYPGIWRCIMEKVFNH